MTDSLYEYQTSVICAEGCPTYFGEMIFLFSDGSYRNLETDHHGKESWGDIFRLYVCDDKTWPLPNRLRMKWVAIAERICYFLDTCLDIETIERLWLQKNDVGDSLYDFFAIGIAPYGKVSLWLHGAQKQTFLGWFSAIDIQQTSEQLPYLSRLTLEEACKKSLENDEETRHYLEQYGLPDPHFYDRLMQQFTYRFLPVLKKWDKDNEVWMEYDEDEIQPELDFVEVKCHDGTFDRLRDGSLLNYHEAGKPSRVCVGWHVGKREYSAYFFFSHDELAQVFRTCYGAHPKTQVDFLLMIDPECDKYETALFRYGMNEPLPIGPEACQVLAFRNKFECYRSPNYTQPKGAWR